MYLEKSVEFSNWLNDVFTNNGGEIIRSTIVIVVLIGSFVFLHYQGKKA